DVRDRDRHGRGCSGHRRAVAEGAAAVDAEVQAAGRRVTGLGRGAGRGHVPQVLRLAAKREAPQTSLESLGEDRHRRADLQVDEWTMPPGATGPPAGPSDVRLPAGDTPRPGLGSGFTVTMMSSEPESSLSLAVRRST